MKDLTTFPLILLDKYGEFDVSLWKIYQALTLEVWDLIMYVHRSSNCMVLIHPPDSR